MKITNSTPNFTGRMVKINEDTYIDSEMIKSIEKASFNQGSSDCSKVFYTAGATCTTATAVIQKPMIEVANLVSLAKTGLGQAIDLTV